MTSVERAFPALLQEFFHRRLIAQRGASAHTIASYRDTFALYLGYAAERTGRTPSALTLGDLDAPMVLDFLDHLETERGNSARTRNLRLTAIRSFMCYAPLREPTLLPVAQRVLAIPVKRFDRPVLGYLSRDEIVAIIDAPDRTTWSGQRDAVLFAVLYNTGARVSEITRLHVADVLLERASSVLLHGKGRKERVVPLWKSTAAQLPQVAPPNRSKSRRRRISQSRGQALVALGRRTSTARRLPKGIGPPPLARDATDLAPHAAPHDRDASAPVWSRHHRHRPLARPRGHGHHPPLRRSRPRHEGGCSPLRRRSRTSAGPLHGHRSAPRLPGSPLTMRSTAPRDRPRPRSPPSQLRIVPNSA